MSTIREILPARSRQVRVLLPAFCGLVFGGAGRAAAQEPVDAGLTTMQGVTFFILWLLCFAGAIAALVFAWRFFKQMMTAEEGTPKMVEIAGYVREGADAYLHQQYKVVGVFFAVIFVLLLILAFGLGTQSGWVPFAFLSGGFLSALAGWCGMKTATWASSRTTAAAQKSLNQGLQVAFRSGAVMGLTVVGLGLLHITVWFFVLYYLVPTFTGVTSLPAISVTLLSSAMGASAQALFARVGGGIYTKAADVGADLVGKVEAGIPEDDERNPATIADNVGDNVGDVAGMGADLYESYIGSILAAAALGVAAFSFAEVLDGRDMLPMQLRAVFLPMLLAAAGIGLSIGGVFLVRTGEETTQKNLLTALGRGSNFAAGCVVLAAVLLTLLMLPGYYWIAGSVIVGLGAGWLIGKWTEYSTSQEFKPTQDLADQALTGPATLIIGGLANGMKSVWCPVLVVVVATLLAFAFGAQGRIGDVTYFALGLYGVGIAAVGMLSTLGITLATDAYGPIADNAGGNAEMSGLGPEVRERTDALDSLGNTTAATGKGFAIGSAALTALALLAAYMEEVRMGFDRWAETALVAEEEPGFYKLSDQFIGRLTLHEVTVGEEMREEREYTGFLAFGDDLADEQIAKQWEALDVRERIPADDDLAPEEDPIIVLGENGVYRFTLTQAPLVAVRRATMPDFMRYYEGHLMNPKVLVGVFVGAMAAFVFCALTMKAVGRAAQGMVEEVRRQFREKPGIMDRTEKPDYATPVAISTKAAQKEMLLPAILGLGLPLVVGFLLGVAGVMGLLVGTLTTGFCMAVFMANAGGSWDNAKKYIESGAHGGKGTEAHKAAVVGDTVGDPFKDTSGPSLNILIKLMTMVSIVAAGFVIRYSLAAMGVF